MKNKEIKQRLENSINEAPMDLLAKIQDTPIRKMQTHDDITRQEKVKTRRPLLRPVALGASVMMLMIIAISGWYQFTMSPDSRIYFDVNPGIEIIMNRREQVIDLIGINREGEALAEAIDYSGEDLATVQNRILEEMVSTNILEGSRQIMLVSALHEDPEESREMARAFDQEIHRFFENQEIELVVLRQSLVLSNTLEEFSKNYNISIGKMTFIRNLMVLNPDLQLENLTDLSLEELLMISMQTGLDLNRIIETDDDYQEFELPEVPEEEPPVTEEEPEPQPEPEPEPAPEPTPEPKPEPRPEPAPENQPVPESILSFSEVRSIALRETGGGEVMEMQYDEEDREYEVVIFHNGYEYEMEIDAFTGRIKDMDVDELDEDEEESSQGDFIGIERAKEIALSRIGGGYIEEIEIDEDDGRWIYEIEAVYIDEDYDLEIDAITGEILSFDGDD